MKTFNAALLAAAACALAACSAPEYAVAPDRPVANLYADDGNFMLVQGMAVYANPQQCLQGQPLYNLHFNPRPEGRSGPWRVEANALSTITVWATGRDPVNKHHYECYPTFTGTFLTDRTYAVKVTERGSACEVQVFDVTDATVGPVRQPVRPRTYIDGTRTNHPRCEDALL